MPVLLASIFTAIAGWFTSAGAALVSLVTVEALKFTAAKAFWMFMICIVFPLLIYNVAVTFVTNMMDVGYRLASDYSNPDSLTLNITGMAGWIAQQIYLPQCISTYLSAVGARFIMSFIPFIR